MFELDGRAAGVGWREKGVRLPRAVINSYKANKVISRRPATMGRRDVAAWSVESVHFGPEGGAGSKIARPVYTPLQPLASGCLPTVQWWCPVQSSHGPRASVYHRSVLNQKVLITRCAEFFGSMAIDIEPDQQPHAL